jgi:hypothetical protein
MLSQQFFERTEENHEVILISLRLPQLHANYFATSTGLNVICVRHRVAARVSLSMKVRTNHL